MSYIKQDTGVVWQDHRHEHYTVTAVHLQLLVRCIPPYALPYLSSHYRCRGLKYVSKYRNERIAAIARFLSQTDYDIITLQELWVFSDYEHVRASVSKNLPYAKFFYRYVLYLSQACIYCLNVLDLLSGALGSGLVIFSKYPIVAATVHPYSLNGSPIDVLAGDWFVGKAAASVLIAHPVLGQTQIFNTHVSPKHLPSLHSRC